MTQTVPTQTQETRRIVSACYAAAKAYDSEAIIGLLDPDIVLREADTLPNAGVHQGIENVMQALLPVFEFFDLSQLTIEAIVADGEYGIGLIDIPIRERPGESHPVSEVYQVRNGKVVQIRAYYWDTGALMAHD